MPKVAILHFSPLELYPPVQNLLSSLDDDSGRHYYVYSTRTAVKHLSTFTVHGKHITIKRYGTSGNNLSSLTRWIGYCFFHVGSFLHMFFNRPSKILYYETLSFLPVYLYKKLLDRNVLIWAHYHEYTSPQEYNAGMRLSRRFHNMERRVYDQMAGLSHTNDQRLAMFLNDISPAIPKSAFAIPNFPPRSWVAGINRKHDDKIRFVYVGALSLNTMYTKQFAKWVIAQSGRVEWDIYTFNMTDNAKSFFENIQSPYINLYNGVDYDKLPEVLSQYDIGLILYIGHIANYIYNAPNKLFEYLRMGLQVWLPNALQGAIPYLDSENHPKVMALDFKNLTLSADNVALKKIIPENKYIAEVANQPLLQYLLI